MSKPRSNKESVKMQLFDGGLNTKYSPPDVPLNASPDLQNVQFSQYGAVETAYGYEQAYDQIASATVDGLHTYTDPNSVRRLMAWCNGSAWVSSGTSGNTFMVVTESTDAYSAGVDVWAYTYQGIVWIGNGSARGYKFDGTTFSQAGVSALTSDLGAVVSGATGSLSGEYSWALTGVNSANAEGDYFLINTAAVTITSGEAVLSGIPVFPTSANVSTKYLYRNTAGVSASAGIYERVTALSAAQTAYTDVASDVDLGDDLAPSTNNVMPSFKFMVEYQGYLFGAGHPSSNTQLRWCTQGLPEKWPETNALEVGEKDGFAITGLRVYNNSIYIQKSDGRSSGSIWILYITDAVGGTGTSAWNLIKSNSAYGGASNKAIASMFGDIVFLDYTGVRKFQNNNISMNPQESSVGTFLVDSISYEIEPNILSLNKEALDSATMQYYRNRLYLCAPDATATENDTMYIYDNSTVSGQGTQLGAWSKLTGPNVNNFVEFNGNLYGGDYDGNIFQIAKPDLYNYDGAAIDTHYWTSFIYGKEEHHDYDKVWRYLFVELEAAGDYDLDIYYRQDTAESGNKDQINLLMPSTLWGTMVWGIDYWNVGFDRRIYRLVLGGMVSKSIQFGFKMNTADTRFRLYNLKCEYNLRRQR